MYSLHCFFFLTDVFFVKKLLENPPKVLTHFYSAYGANFVQTCAYRMDEKVLKKKRIKSANGGGDPFEFGTVLTFTLRNTQIDCITLCTLL